MVTALPPPRTSPPPASEWPGAGVVLSGRYRLSTCIAVGSSAVVWRAHDEQLARDVALKLLLPHLQADDVARNRFRVEALATVRAKHPNAVRVYDAASHDAMTYLVMELVEGRSLSALPRPLGGKEVAAVGAQVGAALQAAHDADLVHRDVKPSNILIDHGGWIKVVDFGIAKLLDITSHLTRPGMGVGTARYISPEALAGEPVGPWTDLYGLGLTLWELAAGRPPHQDHDVGSLVQVRLEEELPPVTDHAPDLPAEVADAIQWLGRRDPDERPRTASAVVERFQEVCGPRPQDLTRSLLTLP